MASPSYHKGLLKSTGIFGFAQLLQMGVQILTTKIVANILGPAGVGLVGMLQNILQLMITAIGFDLLKVGTREFALQASEPNQWQKITEQLLKIGVLVGVLGALLSIAFASFWSRWLFDSDAYAHWFYYLSIYFMAWGITQGRIALMQGLRKVKVYATYQVIQVMTLSGISVLLYYQFGIEAIWMVLLASSIIPMLLAWYFTKSHVMDWHWGYWNIFKTYREHQPIIRLGLLLSVNAIIGQLCFLAIRTYLQQQEDVSLVGYYEVSQAFLVKYMGMLFVAMSYDFYPKLTSLIADNIKAGALVSHQIEIAIYILAPAIGIFYFLGPFLVPILYSKDFLPTLEILQFGWLVLFLKAFTFPVGFYALAKGDKKTFFWQELLGDIGNLAGSLVGYSILGLYGLGIGWVVSYILYGIFIYVILHKKYFIQFKFKFLAEYFIVFLLLFTLGVSSYLQATLWTQLIWLFIIVTYSLQKLITVWKRDRN